MNDTDRVVYIDMDGVMFDFDAAAVAGIPEDQRVVRSSFYITQDYPEAVRAGIRAVCDAPGFFENLSLIPGVIEAWRTLLAHGYHPRVLSAPLGSNPTSVKGKIESLRRHLVPEFGQSVIDEAIFDREKWRYPGLAIIDDRPDIVLGDDSGGVANWEHILFGWPNLETVPNTKARYRLTSWENIDTLIATLDEIYKKRQQTI